MKTIVALPGEGIGVEGVLFGAAGPSEQRGLLAVMGDGLGPAWGRSPLLPGYALAAG